MSDSVLLPQLGESVTEGTVTRWLKAVGDSVRIDEPLVEVSTDKVDTEIPSPFEGVLTSILVPEDGTAEVGSALAIIAVADNAEAAAAEPPAGAASSTAGPAETRPAPSSAASATMAAPTVSKSAGSTGYVTPLVRKLAREHGIALSDVTGTGIGGRIRASDVKASARATAAAAPVTKHGVEAAAAPVSNVSAATSSSLRGTTVKASRIRAVIAKRMRESLDTSTQLTQVHEVDVSRIVRLRERAKDPFAAAHGVNLTYLPFIALAVAEALKAFPMLNASFDESAGAISYHDAEHLAFAVDAPKGLLVPVVRNAGTMNLAGLALGIADVARRSRDGSIMADELSGGTFSITNIGSVGALFDTPIINAPQVGIVGVGAIVKRLGVVAGPDGEDTLAIRHTMYLCLTYDHRIVDGADAGRFLSHVRARLETGAFAAELGL